MNAAQNYAALLVEVQPRPIRGVRGYRRQLAQLDMLMSAPATASTRDLIEVLSLLLAAYENDQFPIADAPPETVLDHLVENSGRAPQTIAHELGMARSTLSNYRCGRRKLTVERVKQFAAYFRVDPSVFLGAAGSSLTPKK